MSRWLFSGTRILFPRVGILVLLAGVVLPCISLGAGLRDFTDGWLLEPGDMAFILTPHVGSGATPAGSVPKPPQKTGWGLWAGAGQGRLFSMSELPLMEVDCGMIRRGSALSWAVGGIWERLGDELLVEDTATLSLRLGENPRLGIRGQLRRWLVDDQVLASHLDGSLDGRFAFGIGRRVTGRIRIWWQPGTLPRWHGRNGRRTLAKISLLHPDSGIALRVDQKSDGTPVISLEGLFRVSSCLGLGVRADPETGSLGGNLVARLGGAWWHSSHLVHPALGTTNRIHLGTGDPEAAAW